MKNQKISLEKLEDAASRLRAISHPMRIAIIDMLEKKGQMNVTQIHLKLKIEQAAASHHLSILKNKNVISFKRDGKSNYYHLKPGVVDKLVECINLCCK